MKNSTTKIVILCGGRGSRLGSETKSMPKPLVEINNQPILLFIMRHFMKYNLNNFILALGYKGFKIKEYFANYNMHKYDLTIKKNKLGYFDKNKKNENWNIDLIDTGKDTLTGGRLLRLKNFVNDTFLLTYGDGVSDVNLKDLLTFHKSHGKIASVTGVKPIPRFGALSINKNNQVTNFSEKKNINEQSWINGGFFVFNKKIFEYLQDDQTILEQDPMNKLVKDNEIMCFKHHGFWQCLDTQRDKDQLESIDLDKFLL